MIPKISEPLRPLKAPLRARLDALIAHLRGVPWRDLRGLVFARAGERTIAPPGDWDAPNRPEIDQIRVDGYTWSAEQLRHAGHDSIMVLEAIERVEDCSRALVRAALGTIELCLDGLVGKELRGAVVNRDRLVQHWPWPIDAESGGALLHLLLSLSPTLPADEILIAAWPADAAVAAVADWAKPWLQKNANEVRNGNVSDLMKRTQRNAPILFALRDRLPGAKLPTSALALLYILEQQVRDDQQRKFIAIDTCKEHTKMIESWRDLPKSRTTTIQSDLKHQRLEMILPSKEEKRHIQLSLEIPDQTFAMQVAQVLREWRGWGGLRHWITFQSLLTRNKRMGWIRWTVDDHLEAMGYSAGRMRRLELRRAAAEMVELFTQIEIGIYDERGKLRERRPLILKGNTFERLEGSEWEIEGLELKVNPLLYRGVRDPATGKLGKNWWPTPEALPHIAHEKYGPAIALGTILPGRWRMELNYSGRTYIDLTGDSMLRAAGLPYRQRNVVATWRALERNLTELQHRGGLDRWKWRGDPGLATLCRLYAPQWAVDRVVHHVPPRETSPAPDALTGSELKAWRMREGLTQSQAAERLGVGERTIRRAEQETARPLTRRLRAALTAFAPESEE